MFSPKCGPNEDENCWGLALMRVSITSGQTRASSQERFEQAQIRWVRARVHVSLRPNYPGCQRDFFSFFLCANCKRRSRDSDNEPQEEKTSGTQGKAKREREFELSTTLILVWPGLKNRWAKRQKQNVVFLSPYFSLTYFPFKCGLVASIVVAVHL